MKNFKLFIEVKEGERIPDYYGMAYRDLAANRKFVAPIPLNLLIRAWVAIWLWAKRNHSSYEMELWNQAYQKGRRDEAKICNEHQMYGTCNHSK